MFKRGPSQKLAMLGVGLHALGLAIVLAAAGIGYALVLQPLDARIDELDGRSVELQAALDDAPNVRAKHERLRRALVAMEAGGTGLEKRVPDEPLEAEFLAQAAQAATQSGLQIGDYRPGAVRTSGHCSQMEIQISCQGPYRSICDFLDRLSAIPRLSQVEKLEISAAGPDGYPVTLWLVVYFRLAKAPADPGAKGGQAHG
jgi:Tfp pilus assembly protein PilO